MEGSDDMPAWVKDMEFLTEPLEGNKANFILQNSQRLRAYFQGRAGKMGQLFATYDRHPPDTALDPQSGVLYFIRTEEGLQDKAISLKSVASGPSKHTWKMAWGRKTHLKKWGVLYKSYRCRHMFQPKSSPPPYRMQIYMLQDHDRDAAKGEKPTEGLALVQILSLQDAPLRRRSGVKRDLVDMEGADCDEEEDDDITCPNSNSSHKFSPVSSVQDTPSVTTAVGTLATVPKTPGSGISALSALGSISSMIVTPATTLGTSTLRSGSNASLDTADVLKKTGASSCMQGRENASRERSMARSVVQRLDMNLGPCADMDMEDNSSKGMLQDDENQTEANGQHKADDGASRNERNWGRDPLDSLELEGCNPHQNRIIKALKLNQQVASASLPRHKAQLQHHFGALSAAVLAEALSGRPWGLPKVDTYAFGQSIWPADPAASDMTALGWASLIRLYASREAEEAEAAAFRTGPGQGKEEDEAEAGAEEERQDVSNRA